MSPRSRESAQVCEGMVECPVVAGGIAEHQRPAAVRRHEHDVPAGTLLPAPALTFELAGQLPKVFASRH